jgi:hypothetical protein
VPLVTTFFSFQPVPPILIILESTAPNTSCTQNLDLVMNDQIVQRTWEQNPPQSPLNMDNPMDVE